MNIYLVMIIGGMLGIGLNAFKTIAAINKRNNNVNFKKTWSMFWASDWFNLVVSGFCYAVLLFLASEYVDLNKLETPDFTQSLKERVFNFRLATFIKTASVIGGYFAQSLVYGWLGVTEKRIKTGTNELYSAPKDAEIKNS